MFNNLTKQNYYEKTFYNCWTHVNCIDNEILLLFRKIVVKKMKKYLI